MTQSEFPKRPEGNCDCQFCREYHHLEAAKSRRDIDELLDLAEYFASEFWNASEQLSYRRYKDEQ